MHLINKLLDYYPVNKGLFDLKLISATMRNVRKMYTDC